MTDTCSPFEGVGFVRGDGDELYAIDICHVPGRKRVALCITDTRVAPASHSTVLGYFRDEESATKAIAILEKFIVAKTVERGMTR